MGREMKFANRKAEELYDKLKVYRSRIDFIKRKEMGSDLYSLSLIWDDLSGGMKDLISKALAGEKDAETIDTSLSELSTNISDVYKACEELKQETNETTIE